MACSQDIKDTTPIFDCPICLEKFKTPVYLPCLHTFCELCLETYINSMVTEDELTFNCPVCRMKCDLKDKDSEKWTAQFPFNYLLSSLMSNEDDSPDKLLPRYCDPCQRVGEQIKAIKWCCDCNEAYCSDCSKSFHNRVRNAHSHTVTEITNEQTVPKYLNTKSEEPCLKHKGRPVEVICKTHFALCCVVCLTDDHLECKDVQPIDDIIANFSSVKYGEKYIHDLTSIEQDIQEVVSSKERQIKELDDHKEKLILDAEKMINEVIEMLVALKKDVQRKVSNEHKLVKKTKELQIDTLNGVKLNVSQSLQILEVLSGYENSRQLLYMLLKIKPNFSKHYKLFSGYSLVDDCIRFDLKIDPTLLYISSKQNMSCDVHRRFTFTGKNEYHISVEKALQTFDKRFKEIFYNKLTDWHAAADHDDSDNVFGADSTCILLEDWLEEEPERQTPQERVVKRKAKNKSKKITRT